MKQSFTQSVDGDVAEGETLTQQWGPLKVINDPVNLDFTCFVSDYWNTATPFDITVCSADGYRSQFHKYVLRKISAMFRAAIGEENEEEEHEPHEIHLPHVSGHGLRFLRELVYIKAKERSYELMKDRLNEMNVEYSTIDFRKDLFLLVGKYEIAMVRKFALEYFAVRWTPRASWHTNVMKMLEEMILEGMVLDDIKSQITKTLIKNSPALTISELQNFDIGHVKSFVNSEGDWNSSFVGGLLTYAYSNKGDTDLRNMLLKSDNVEKYWSNVIPFDITLSCKEGSKSDFHKYIVCKISESFRAILADEENTTDINLPRVSENGLRFLHELIYNVPNDKDYSFMTERLDAAQVDYCSLTFREDLLVLVGKYNIEKARKFALEYFVNRWMPKAEWYNTVMGMVEQMISEGLVLTHVKEAIVETLVKNCTGLTIEEMQNFDVAHVKSFLKSDGEWNATFVAGLLTYAHSLKADREFKRMVLASDKVQQHGGGASAVFLSNLRFHADSRDTSRGAVEEEEEVQAE